MNAFSPPIPAAFRLLLAIGLALSAGLIPRLVVKADLGPKPSMDFEFISKTGDPVSIQSGEQLECEQPDCSDGKPLMEGGPQRFECQETSCSSTAYGYKDYHRLRITFADGVTRESNVFGQRYFDARYRVTVRENDLLVVEQRGGLRPPGMLELVLGGGLLLLCGGLIIGLPLGILGAMAVRSRQGKAGEALRWLYPTAWVIAILLLTTGGFFTLALPVTALIEALVAFGYARLRRLAAAPLVTALILVNLLTLPALWATMNLLGVRASEVWSVLAVAEVLIWLLEGGVLWLTQNRTLRFREAMVLSLLANAASFVVGLLLPI